MRVISGRGPHGRLSPSSGLASLIVYSFRLETTKVQHRLTQVEIQLVYSSDAKDINVWGIAFNGTFLLSPPATAKEEKMTIEAAPAGFSASLQRERERVTATVTGSIRIGNRISGHPDSASLDADGERVDQGWRAYPVRDGRPGYEAGQQPLSMRVEGRGYYQPREQHD